MNSRTGLYGYRPTATSVRAAKMVVVYTPPTTLKLAAGHVEAVVLHRIGDYPYKLSDRLVLKEESLIPLNTYYKNICTPTQWANMLDRAGKQKEN